MQQAVVDKGQEPNLTPSQKGMLKRAKVLLNRFHRESGMCSFDRTEGFTYIGKIKSALGMPESGLTLEDLGVSEESLIHEISLR